MKHKHLYELHISGLSFTQIANKLKLTRCQVAGRIYRYKQDANNQPYQLKDLDRNMCHYPYGDKDYTFCGQPVKKGKPYCEEHFDKCYRKRKQYEQN